MESAGSGAAPDCGVGSIVWVRRRNGSWWPGKILGPDELPASHLTSPRTGTPVKLLGREDASVDWYNLEKSKRVKAFRCGEFDDCIERAESSQGMPPKKREKYARREDAILHALELEKELLRKQGKLDLVPDRARSKSSGPVKKDSGDSDINNGKTGIAKSNQLLKRQDTFGKGENVGSPLHSQNEKEANQPSLENDQAEVIPRMKGLQDLGLKTANATEKLTPPGALDGPSSKPTFFDDAQSPSGMIPSMGRIIQTNGKTSLDKRKRSHEGLNEELSVKRRDRRRPLLQVLQSSAKLEVPHFLRPDFGTLSASISGEEMSGNFRAKRSRSMYLPSEYGDASDYKDIHSNQIEMLPSQFGESHSYPFRGQFIEDDTCEFMEDIESGSSESTSSESESDSDSSETEPDMDEDMATISGAIVPTEVEWDALRRPEVLEDVGSMSIEESDESSLSGDMSHFYPHDPLSVNEAVSQWQLKGKRNMRSLTTRSRVADAKSLNGSIHRNYNEQRRVAFTRKSSGQSSYRNDDFSDDTDMAGFGAKDLRMQLAGLDNGGYSRTLRPATKGHNMIDWEMNRARMKRNWDDKGRHFNQPYFGHRYFGGRTRSMLLDVDLKVQANYQKEPVPIVSLMSKYDGKAIIGHPIQIEVLEDGSSDAHLPANAYFGNGLFNYDGNTSLSPAWRTAKRTNFRVPRSHPSSTLGIDEAMEDHPFLDPDRKPPFKKLNSGNFHNKAGLIGKSIAPVLRSPTERKFQKKLPKRVSSSSSQKTRTLSSIGIEHTLSTKAIHNSSNSQMNALIKPESSGPTTVACIPVKLVFSRLLEKINRPPSKPVSKVVLPTADAVRASS